ncbi:MAG: hypothetical protein H6707_14655 [Deltaproteobacteria bacterium]|nr:hypothetical protein [Deltaproteobacteria bacterium]
MGSERTSGVRRASDDPDQFLLELHRDWWPLELAVRRLYGELITPVEWARWSRAFFVYNGYRCYDEHYERHAVATVLRGADDAEGEDRKITYNTLFTALEKLIADRRQDDGEYRPTEAAAIKEWEPVWSTLDDRYPAEGMEDACIVLTRHPASFLITPPFFLSTCRSLDLLGEEQEWMKRVKTLPIERAETAEAPHSSQALIEFSNEHPEGQPIDSQRAARLHGERAMFDLFIDHTGRVWRKSPPGTCRLGPKEFRMLRRFVQRKRPLIPARVGAEIESNSPSAANGMFKRIRIKLEGRNKERQHAFFYKSSGEPTTYSFSPAVTTSYCILLAADDRQ